LFKRFQPRLESHLHLLRLTASMYILPTVLVFFSLVCESVGLLSGSISTPAELGDETWNLVWFTDPGWEYDYVPNQVLSQVPTFNTDSQDIGNVDADKLVDKTIAVVRIRPGDGGNCDSVVELEKAFSARNLKRAYLLLGEEEYGCDECTEFFENASLVFRNYFHEDCVQYGDRIEFIPLGFKDPAPEGLNRETALADRNLTWSFSTGHWCHNREKFVQQFSDHYADHYSLTVGHHKYDQYADAMQSAEPTDPASGKKRGTNRRSLGSCR